MIALPRNRVDIESALKAPDFYNDQMINAILHYHYEPRIERRKNYLPSLSLKYPGIQYTEYFLNQQASWQWELVPPESKEIAGNIFREFNKQQIPMLIEPIKNKGILLSHVIRKDHLTTDERQYIRAGIQRHLVDGYAIFVQRQYWRVLKLSPVRRQTFNTPQVPERTTLHMLSRVYGSKSAAPDINPERQPARLNQPLPVEPLKKSSPETPNIEGDLFARRKP